MPGPRTPWVLLDAGATTDCSAELLFQFAVMGTVYAHEILHIPEPTVGLMSIGGEDSKGNEITKEAFALLKDQHIHVDTMRVRGFPFADEVVEFINDHDQVFVVEQNEAGQLRMLLINECEIDPKRLVKVLHYDGTPITAGFIAGKIAEAVKQDNVTPLRKQVAS